MAEDINGSTKNLNTEHHPPPPREGLEIELNIPHNPRHNL
jgi:hypothetical protein